MDHSCAALPSTGVKFNFVQPLKPIQAFVVAGGNIFINAYILLPGAKAWTHLAPLPIYPGRNARASIIRGKMRVVGGESNRSTRLEVIFATLITNDLMIFATLTTNDLLPGRCSSITQHRGTSG